MLLRFPSCVKVYSFYMVSPAFLLNMFKFNSDPFFIVLMMVSFKQLQIFCYGHMLT